MMHVVLKKYGAISGDVAGIFGPDKTVIVVVILLDSSSKMTYVECGLKL